MMGQKIGTGLLAKAVALSLVIVGGGMVARGIIDRNEAYYQGIISDQMKIIERLDRKVVHLRSRVETKRDGNRSLEDQLAKFRELEERAEVAEGWVPVEMTLTMYAPFDPASIEGFDYSGDPGVTASGEPSQPGVSLAAGRNIPFGTRFYIPGFGVGVVHDRGGAIGDKNLDLMVSSRNAALRFGRQTMVVWMEPGRTFGED